MDPGFIVGLSLGLAVLVLLILVFGCKYAKKGEKDKHDLAKEKLLGSGPAHRLRSDTTMSTEFLRNEIGSKEAEKNNNQTEGKRKCVSFTEKEWSDEENNYNQSDQNNYEYSYHEPRQRLFTEYLRNNNIKKQRICREYKDGVCQVDERINDRECSNRKSYIDRGRKHLQKDNQTSDKPQSCLKSGIKKYVSEKVIGKRGENHRRKYKNKAETTERKHALTRQPSVKQILEEVKRNSKLNRQNGTCITVNSGKEVNKIADKTCSSDRSRSSEESNREWSRPNEIVQTVNVDVRAEFPSRQARYTDYKSHTLRQQKYGSRPEYETRVNQSREMISGEGRPAVPIKPTMRIRGDRSQFVQTAPDMEHYLPPVRNNSFTEALSTWVLHSERAEKIPQPQSSITYTISQVKPKFSVSNQCKIDTNTSFDLTCETEPKSSHQDFSQCARSTSTGCNKSSYMNSLPNEPSAYPQELQQMTSSEEHLGASESKIEKHISQSTNRQLLANSHGPQTTRVNTTTLNTSLTKRVSPATYQESRSPETAHHRQQPPKTNIRLQSPQRPFTSRLSPATDIQDLSEPQHAHGSDHPPSPNINLQSAAAPENKQQVLHTTSMATRTSPTLNREQILGSNMHSQTPTFKRTKLSPESYQEDPDANTEQSLSPIQFDNSMEQVSTTSLSVDHRKEQQLASISVYQRNKQLSAPTLDEQKIEQSPTFIPVDNRKEQPSTNLPPSFATPIKSATHDKLPTTVNTVSKHTDMESLSSFDSRPVTTPLQTLPAETHGNQFHAVKSFDSVTLVRNDFQGKDSLDWITSESDFNPGQTSTPHQSKTDVPGITTESEFNPGQTSTPQRSKTDVPGIKTESDFNPYQKPTHHQNKTGFRGNINESEFNPDQTATLEESKTKVPGHTSETVLNPVQTSTYEQSLTEVLANSSYQTSHRTMLHSILKKRRGVVSLSGQDLSRSNSDDTMLSVIKSASVNRTLSSPRVDQLETPAKKDQRDLLSSILPEKLATVKDIRKDPAIHVLLEEIKARRKSSSGSS